MRLFVMWMATLGAVAAGCDGSGLVRAADASTLETDADGSLEPDTDSDAASDTTTLDTEDGPDALSDTTEDGAEIDEVDGEGGDADAGPDVSSDGGDADTDEPDGVHDGDDTADTTDTTDTADTTDVADTTIDGPWRSALYPEGWVPGDAGPEGARLQDYSYAGYHRGERAFGAGLEDAGGAALLLYDVVDFGAVPVDPAAPLSGEDSSVAFQAAIDEAAAAGGGIVYVPTGLYRIDAWLAVNTSRIVLSGDGPDLSRLWFTRRVGLNFAAHIQIGGTAAPDGGTDLVSDADVFDSVIEVADATWLEPGDEIVLGHTFSAEWIAGLGMSQEWSTLVDTWQTLYRRTVVALDTTAEPHRVTLDVPLRGPLPVALGARLERVTGLVSEVGLEHLGLANAIEWEEAWAGRSIYAVALANVRDAWVHDVASFPSPSAPASGKGAGAHLQSSGILVTDSSRVTLADCHLALAQNRGEGDGHLFEVRRSGEILTRDSSARHGHHNFIQTGGFGTSGCVWLRVAASDGASVPLGPLFDSQQPAPSTFLFGLTTANLVDASTFDDDFYAVNQAPYGHGATECAFWNIGGRLLMSLQLGRGYVIGTSGELVVLTSTELEYGIGTEPEDWVEGQGAGHWLIPASLYEDQLAGRLARPLTRDR